MKSLLERLPKPTLRITPTALQTAETYVRLVAEEAGSPIESTGFLLGEPGPGGPGPLVTDVILAHDQTVSSGSVRISPRGVLATGREISRRAMKCLGWFHAHPSTTFHSSIDDENLEVILKDVSSSNCWSISESREAQVSWENEALVVRTGIETVRIPGDKVRALISDTDPRPGDGDAPAETTNGSELRADVECEALTAAEAYSLVLSASGASKPYARVAREVRCAVCGHRESLSHLAEVELVDPETVNTERMRAEVREKVTNLKAVRRKDEDKTSNNGRKWYVSLGQQISGNRQWTERRDG